MLLTCQYSKSIQKVLADLACTHYHSGNGFTKSQTQEGSQHNAMGSKQTIVINGKVYDAVTGLPVAAPEAHTTTKLTSTPVVKPAVTQVNLPTRNTNHAAAAHQNVQRSKTLRRDVLKKPVEKAKVGTAKRRPEAGRVARSESISRFAPHPQPIIQSKKPAPRLDITPNKFRSAAIIAHKHALVADKPVVQAAKKHDVAVSAKEQLIAKRLANVQQIDHSKTTRDRRSGHPRAFRIATASLAIMIIGGYLTYLSMPGLSVRVAAAQAGVAASFPEYSPDGYRFSGPVAYSPGQVAIQFLANGGTAKYTLTEQKSAWDSQAVYDNLVAKDADDNYTTNSQQGLTIYTYKGHAAWVNGGILYTIEGDAPLSNEQLLKIAGSL